MKVCLMPHCQNVFPSAQRINGKKKNYCNRKYCFECSPFGKHRIRRSPSVKPTHCDLCEKPISEAYKRSNQKRCGACQVKIHRIVMKQRAVELLGGCCLRCDWRAESIAELAAMEFHHPNKDKDFNVGAWLNLKWDSLVSEIEKCQLLCSRCHRIEHSKRNEKLAKAVLSHRLNSTNNLTAG